MANRTNQWIKLTLHDRHPKVVAIAVRLGISTERALTLAIRWLHYVDQHIDHERVALSRDQIDQAVDCKGFCDALASDAVRWLNRKSDVDCDAFTVRNYRKYFGWRQQRNADAAERMRRIRGKQESDHVARNSCARGEQSRQRPEEISTFSAGEVAAGGSACSARQWDQVLTLVKACHVAPNCMPKCREYLARIPSPLAFVTDVKVRALQKGCVGEALAKYVFGAIKREAAKHGTSQIKSDPVTHAMSPSTLAPISSPAKGPLFDMLRHIAARNNFTLPGELPGEPPE